MSEGKNSPAHEDDPLLQRLTENFSVTERRHFRKEIDSIREDLVRSALHEVRVVVLVVAGIVTFVFTGFGFISWSGIHGDIVEDASRRLSGDAVVQDDAAKRASERIRFAKGLEDSVIQLETELKKLHERAKEVEKEIEAPAKEMKERLAQVQKKADEIERRLDTDAAAISRSITSEVKTIFAMLERIEEEAQTGMQRSDPTAEPR